MRRLTDVASERASGDASSSTRLLVAGGDVRGSLPSSGWRAGGEVMSDVWTVLPREGAERALASLGAVEGKGQEMLHGLFLKRSGLASTYATEVA